jgi:hypothetical protein
MLFLFIATVISPRSSFGTRWTFPFAPLWKTHRYTQQSSNDSSSLLDGGEANMLVSYVNGIYHTVEDWRRITQQIRSIFNMEVLPFYNPSSGWWVRDATTAGYSIVLRPSDSYLSRQLADHLRNVLKRVGEHGRVLHIAHSGGAILTYLAAKHHLTKSETSRIDVVTFGAGKSITRKYFPGRVCNYYTRNDPLIFMDTRVIKLYQRSIMQRNLRRPNASSLFISFPQSHMEGMLEMRDKKHNTSFIFMDPQYKNPLNDHSLEGDAYRKGLIMEARIFWESFEQIQRAFQLQSNIRKSHIRRIRKRFARISGIHHFWKRLKLLILDSPSCEELISVDILCRIFLSKFPRVI